MAGLADKLSNFQAITGLQDADLCTEILSAQNWDLKLDISSITNAPSSAAAAAANKEIRRIKENIKRGNNFAFTNLLAPNDNNQSPGLAWRIITLPFSIISASLGLIPSAIDFGMWAASGVLSYSLSMVGLSGSSRAGSPPVSRSATEEANFISSFERDYSGRVRPNFIAEGFMDALQRSRHEYMLLFVYLHSPEHPDSPIFCEGTLCDEMLVAFLNENFVA
ncbi:fas-associated factor 2-a [Phtheirospermum japonicum]|uniref:Fas-associated factor 2-a n=1 Tax=Phtheirospermum japonicum TaxID=374723 RepID=A0A830D7R8_9LAMI|nr:fas-associated factor 2-a [Phtheirospermum japonicum]